VVRPDSASKVAYITSIVPANACYVGFCVGLFFDGVNVPQANSTITLYNPQVELGLVPTEYEEYTIRTATSDANGAVLGLTSLSPVTVLLSDNPNAVISLEYNADTKRYIDNKFAQFAALVSADELA
jgi:hypothetical protein